MDSASPTDLLVGIDCMNTIANATQIGFILEHQLVVISPAESRINTYKRQVLKRYIACMKIAHLLILYTVRVGHYC